MTDGPTGHMGPPNPGPEEGTFTEFMAAHLNPEDVAWLAASDWEGVPITRGFQFVDATAEWTKRMNEEEVTPELVSEISAGLAECESEYPGAPMWDRARYLFASQLLNKGHLQPSMDMVYGMHSPHRMAQSLMLLAHREQGRADMLYGGFLQRFTFDAEGKERLKRLMQALVDEALQDDPLDEAIDRFEVLLRREDPNYDPVQAWADSQSELTPEINWGDIAAYVKNEELWEGVPIRFRQSTMMLNIETLKSIGQPSTDMVASIGERIAGFQERYPEAKAWDEFRVTLALHLIERGYPAFALDFGRAVGNTRYQQGLISSFLEVGAVDEGLALASGMADAKLMTESLLDAGDMGRKRLVAMISNKHYPVERRIACLEVIRDRFEALGKTELAAEYARRAAALREQSQDK